MQIKKNFGVHMEPWGTPLVALLSVVLPLPIQTHSSPIELKVFHQNNDCIVLADEFSVRECQRLPTGLLQFVIVVDENNQLQECPTFFLFHLFRLRSAYTLGTGGKSSITLKNYEYVQL